MECIPETQLAVGFFFSPKLHHEHPAVSLRTLSKYYFQGHIILHYRNAS